MSACIPLLNLVAAFLVAGWSSSSHRRESRSRRSQILLNGAFGYGEGLGFTLYYATNFIFTGLAVAVAFHAGLFNIGGEGQAYLGGLGVGAGLPRPRRAAVPIVIAPAPSSAPALFGAAWAFIPA